MHGPTRYLSSADWQLHNNKSSCTHRDSNTGPSAYEYSLSVVLLVEISIEYLNIDHFLPECAIKLYYCLVPRGRCSKIFCRVLHLINYLQSANVLIIWISYFARRILEGVFVGGIVNIRNECLFFSVHGKWIAVRNKQIAWTAIFFFAVHGKWIAVHAEQTNRTRTASRFTRFVCSALRFISHEPRKKDTHSLKKLLFQYIHVFTLVLHAAG